MIIKTDTRAHVDLIQANKRQHLKKSTKKKCSWNDGTGSSFF